MTQLFTERVPFKPFEYPIYYTEGWLKQAQAFWLHTEIPMQGDLKDWNENLNKSEKHLVGNILLGFAQTECAVSDYWTTMVTKWFPKHEIKQMSYDVWFTRNHSRKCLLISKRIIRFRRF